MKTPERRHWRHSGVFIVNFEHISHLALLLFLNMQMPTPLWEDISSMNPIHNVLSSQRTEL